MKTDLNFQKKKQSGYTRFHQHQHLKLNEKQSVCLTAYIEIRQLYRVIINYQVDISRLIFKLSHNFRIRYMLFPSDVIPSQTVVYPK